MATNKNIYSLQLLRNGTAYTSKTEAYNALSAATALENVVKKDGVAVLARYLHTENEVTQVRTLVGYYADASVMTGTTGGSYMTIIDVEGSAAEVQEIRNMIGTGVTTANTATQQLEALRGTTADTSAATSVAGAKKYADEKVAEELGKLTATTVAGESKVVTDVTQTGGKITATSANLTGVKLEGYTEGSDADIAATDTLGQALGKLQAQINAMDKDASAVAGQVVTTVAEADGKVTETKANVKDLQLGGYAKDASATGDIASTDTINEALSKLENKVGANKITNADKSIVVTEPTGTATTTDIKVNIKSGEHVLAKDGNGGLYTNIALSSITPSSTTVKEEYQLTATDGTALGGTIKIYKDSSISKIYLGYSTDTVDADTGLITSGTTGEPQSLNYVYHKEDGKYEMVHVDVSKFLVESEFASGVTADASGVVHGVVDPNSETDSQDTPVNFLTVDANGFKINGIKAEIDRKIAALDATVTGGTTAATGTAQHVKVEVAEADGVLTTVTVNEADIASEAKLNELSGKTITVVESSNNSIAASLTAATDGIKKLDVITDASKINVSGFTAETGGFTAITEDSTVTEAFKVVEDVILKNEQTVSAALTDLDATKVDVIEVNGVASKASATTDVVASVVIDGADIKLDGYAKGQDASAVAATDTVNQAIGKLENQIDAAVAGGLQSVEAGDGINVTAVAQNKQTISVNLKADDATSGWVNPLKVDATSKGLYFDSIDCGTY